CDARIFGVLEGGTPFQYTKNKILLNIVFHEEMNLHIIMGLTEITKHSQKPRQLLTEWAEKVER
ncbi:MAG: hypothetical protein ABGX20_01530, partial [Bacillus sp. (in: firmicutes)]